MHSIYMTFDQTLTAIKWGLAIIGLKLFVSIVLKYARG